MVVPAKASSSFFTEYRYVVLIQVVTAKVKHSSLLFKAVK